MTIKTALVFLANGAEEMETVITVDVLRRANIDVTLVGIDMKPTDSNIVCSRSIKIVPDIRIEELTKLDYDSVIIPGGLNGAKTCADVLKD